MTPIQQMMTKVQGSVRTYEPYSKAWAEAEMRRFNAHEMPPKDGISCSICKNRTLIAHIVQGKPPFQDMWYVEDEPCPCVEQRAALRKRAASGMQEQIENTGEYVATEQWQKVIKAKADMFCEQDQCRCFFIGGQSGAGKSHISTLICNRLIEKGHALLFKKWTELVDKLAAYDNDDRDKLFREVTDIKVLYIDDLLKPTGTFNSREIRATFDVIDRRYCKRDAITIISSELTLQQIQKVDEATGRRIAEMATDEYTINIAKDTSKIYRAVEWRYGE